MEIGARLQRLELCASNPDDVAAFYATAFCMTTRREGDAVVCRGPQRELRLVPGEPGRLHRVTFNMPSRERLDAYRGELAARGIALQEAADIDTDTFTVADPEGRLLTFTARLLAPDPSLASLPAARLQHFAVRTSSPAALVDFYVERLGFTASDRVYDAEGDLGAAFLRTDSEHHVLAIFRSPEVRFDHFSCETHDWHGLRDWADHMSEVGIDLAWGIGRHGPGNDTFLMVRDPDGSMGEISCDLEVCTPERPVGTWPHRPQTLNRWGVAIMRG